MRKDQKLFTVDREIQDFRDSIPVRKFRACASYAKILSKTGRVGSAV